MEYNEVAAGWWAQHIRELSIDNYDRGEDSVEGNFAMLAAFINARNCAPLVCDVVSFENELAKIIKERVESNGSMTLNCDCGLKDVLLELAFKHNINCNRFPQKAHMIISKEEVSVSYGYGKPYKVIYPET